MPYLKTTTADVSDFIFTVFVPLKKKKTTSACTFFLYSLSTPHCSTVKRGHPFGPAKRSAGNHRHGVQTWHTRVRRRRKALVQKGERNLSRKQLQGPVDILKKFRKGKRKKISYRLTIKRAYNNFRPERRNSQNVYTVIKVGFLFFKFPERTFFGNYFIIQCETMSECDNNNIILSDSIALCFFIQFKLVLPAETVFSRRNRKF